MLVCKASPSALACFHWAQGCQVENYITQPPLQSSGASHGYGLANEMSEGTSCKLPCLIKAECVSCMSSFPLEWTLGSASLNPLEANRTRWKESGSHSCPPSVT